MTAPNFIPADCRGSAQWQQRHRIRRHSARFGTPPKSVRNTKPPCTDVDSFAVVARTEPVGDEKVAGRQCQQRVVPGAAAEVDALPAVADEGA